MKKNKLLWLVAVFAFLFWAFIKSSNESEKRNKIEFVDSFDLVQDNILALDSLIKHANAKCDADYAISFGGDKFWIMNHKTDDRLHSGYFCTSAKISVNEFNKTLTVLKRNGINSVYTQYKRDVLIFTYKSNNYTDFSLLREIIIDEKNNGKIMQLDHSFMDRKGKLILIRPIDIR